MASQMLEKIIGENPIKFPKPKTILQLYPVEVRRYRLIDNIKSKCINLHNTNWTANTIVISKMQSHFIETLGNTLNSTLFPFKYTTLNFAKTK